MKKKIKKYLLILLSLSLMVTSLVGISAYFTDTETVTNVVEIGKIDIELLEPSWNGTVDVTPNAVTKKDPQVKNIGSNDAFVFLEVVVPYLDVDVVDNTGGDVNTQYVSMFGYQVNSGWVEVDSLYDEGENGTVTKVYAYVGNNTDEMYALTPGSTTNALFDTILFANVVDSQGLEEQTLSVLVNAYAIQANDINSGIKDPNEVWKVTVNSVTKEVSTAAELESALSTGIDVKLINDITIPHSTPENVPTVAGEAVVLDLNGHTLMASEVFVANNGSLTINANGGGAVEGANMYVYDGGTITINGGTFNDIDFGGDGPIIINGGEINLWVQDPNWIENQIGDIIRANGGTFNFDPSLYGYVNADTHMVINNEDGTWTVWPVSSEGPEEPEAPEVPEDTDESEASQK